MIGFFFGSLKRDPLKELDEERARTLKGLRYYSSEIHRAAFALPRFAVEYFRRK
jgi:spermidine synthase